jgi:putative (di)nucleoside polyphosphate hydrolase
VKGEAWQMPQGGIEKKESPRAAAIRELKEELGISNAEIIAENRDWLRYDLPLEITPKGWDGQFRGQEQKWFVLRFLGDDREIDLDSEGAEFSAWKWVDIACLPDLIIWFKRPIYLELVKRFSELAKPAFDLK